MRMGHEDVAARSRPRSRLHQGCDVARIRRAGIDDRHLAASDDISAGPGEGERDRHCWRRCRRSPGRHLSRVPRRTGLRACDRRECPRRPSWGMLASRREWPRPGEARACPDGERPLKHVCQPAAALRGNARVPAPSADPLPRPRTDPMTDIRIRLQARPTLAGALWPEQVSSPASALARATLLALIGKRRDGAVGASLSVPFWPVPMTMESFAVLVIGAAFGLRLGTAAHRALPRSRARSGCRSSPARRCTGHRPAPT